jgi:hypothetical protein
VYGISPFKSEKAELPELTRATKSLSLRADLVVRERIGLRRAMSTLLHASNDFFAMNRNFLGRLESQSYSVPVNFQYRQLDIWADHDSFTTFSA